MREHTFIVILVGFKCVICVLSFVKGYLLVLLMDSLLKSLLVYVKKEAKGEMYRMHLLGLFCVCTV
jgi:hypothetical protein